MAVTWSQDDCEAIDRVIVHCEMYMWAHQGNPYDVLDEIARTFRQFGTLHLVAAMFLLEQKKQPIGGFVYPILKKVGLEALLNRIQNILNEPVGKTTFGDLLRLVRNKLATHGDLSEQALPAAVQAVRADPRKHPNVDELTEDLAIAIGELRERLAAERESHCGDAST